MAKKSRYEDSPIYQQAQAEIEAAQAPETDPLNVAVIRLAELTPLEYDKVRATEAAALGVRASTLDAEVRAARKRICISRDDSGDIEPHPQPIEPVNLLDTIERTINRFIVCEPQTATAAALWIASTWFIDVAQVAPLAVITAPEKRCGKSQLLTLIGKLSRRPMTASSISPAALFRSIDAWQPTLLIDETDALLKDNEELRGLLNAGHTRDSAYVIRVVGDDFTPTKFSVWGCKALSGIGHIADTLIDRAIMLELRRKLPHEMVDRLRYAEAGLFDGLAAKLARFMGDYSEQVRAARPSLPDALNDRAQDNWEPLFAIADVAGGHWPDTARAAALHIAAKGEEGAAMSAGIELLGDIREVFEQIRRERLTTADLIHELCSDDERPWATYNRGKPLSPRQLGKKLGGYGIASKTVRFGMDTKKGYERSQFDEAFSRYLPDAHEGHPDSIRHTSQNAGNHYSGAVCRVTEEKNVTSQGQINVTKPALSATEKSHISSVTSANVTKHENESVTSKNNRNSMLGENVTCDGKNPTPYRSTERTTAKIIDEVEL
jgi:putative DNA primase/helicase